MREATSRWLEPMLSEAEKRDIAIWPLMQRASIAAEEVNWEALGEPPPIVTAFRKYGTVPGTELGVTDWITFGQLLRDELEWTDYPDLPPDDSAASG